MRFALASLLVHALLGGAMAWLLAHDGAHVAGSAGLSGALRTRFDVTMDAGNERNAPRPQSVRKAPTLPTEVKAPPLPIAEGLPIAVKNEKPRKIETPPEGAGSAQKSRLAPSVGDSAAAPVGTPGQDGMGSSSAVKIGDSDRTNRLGLYLQKMHRKIQSNLATAGYLEFPAHAKLLLDLKRNGTVSKITVTESSGDPALDRLAIRAVQKSIPFDPWDQDQPVQLPVEFR